MVKSSSPFAGRSDNFVAPKKVYDPVIIDTYLKEVVVKTGEGNDEFFVDKVLSECGKKDRQKFLDAQAEDVGVLNIIRKAALSGEDVTDGRFGMKQQGFVDLDQMPQTLEATINLAQEKERIWKNLDPELKQNLSFEAFCQSINDEKLTEYVKAKINKNVVKTEEKSEEVK